MASSPQSVSTTSTPISAKVEEPTTQQQQQRFVPHHSPNHHPTKGRYITSNDPRGYLPVYEYPLNGQWIMMDMDDGYILWTGIWKALGNHKADIVKMLESQPDLATQLRRVRGGYLKIQGTWLAYEVARRLARRVAWPIRHDLVPLFGPTFPTECLAPDQPGYGTVIPSTGRRKPRRSLQSVGIPPPHSFPYPPKLPLAKEYGYPGEQQQQQSYPEQRQMPRQMPPTLHLQTTTPPPEYRESFSTPSIPSVPPLVPTMQGHYAPYDHDAQYNTPSSASGPAGFVHYRERSNRRYSPYPRHAPSPSSASSYTVPSPLGFDDNHPHPVIHGRASAPNLRHVRAHHQQGRLSLSSTQSYSELKSSLPRISALDPEPLDNNTTVPLRRLKSGEENAGDVIAESTADKEGSSPFNESAPPSAAFVNPWHTLPPSNVSGRWIEAQVDYGVPVEHPTFYRDQASAFSDPSSASPSTNWSYDGGMSGPSPPAQHLHYRPSHHPHYSNGCSYDDRRMSIAESVSYPEHELPVYHRYSQPHLHDPMPPPHLEMWMRERSGSFAEPSYGPPVIVGNPELADQSLSSAMMPFHHDLTPSPPMSGTPEHYGSMSGGGLSPSTLQSHGETVQPIATW